MTSSSFIPLFPGDSGPARATIPLLCDPKVEQLAAVLSNQIHTIVEETTTVWINVHNILTFLPTDEDGGGGGGGGGGGDRDKHVCFIWASERSSYRHLEMVTYSLATKTSKRTVITAGEWQVDDTQVCLDEKTGAIFFSGTKATPLESHVYRVDLVAGQPHSDRSSTNGGGGGGGRAGVGGAGGDPRGDAAAAAAAAGSAAGRLKSYLHARWGAPVRDIDYFSTSLFVNTRTLAGCVDPVLLSGSDVPPLMTH